MAIKKKAPTGFPILAVCSVFLNYSAALFMMSSFQSKSFRFQHTQAPVFSVNINIAASFCASNASNLVDSHRAFSTSVLSCLFLVPLPFFYLVLVLLLSSWLMNVSSNALVLGPLFQISAIFPLVRISLMSTVFFCTRFQF